MRRFAIAALALAFVACSDSSENAVEPTGTPLAGVYSLKTIEGLPLPRTYPDGMVLTSVALTIAPDGSYRNSVVYSDGEFFVDVGTVTANGDGTFTFTTPGQYGINHYPGTVDGNVLTWEVGGMTWVFNKF